MIRFLLNDKEITTDLPTGSLLLDFIRYHKNLTGTKIGCREGDCGACTVLVGEMRNENLQYRSVTSCLMALGNAHGKHIVTIEGVNLASTTVGQTLLNPIQQFFCEEGASQCGFCTPGFIVSLAGFCLNGGNAIEAIDGNICRCTGYKSIERATEKLSVLMDERNGGDALEYAIKKSILPPYFSSVKERLQGLQQNEKTDKKTGKIFLGGGTDLYVQKPEEMLHADIDFVVERKDLKTIRIENDKCYIGGAATVTDLLESDGLNKAFPQLKKYLKLVSSTQIRNMATVAGNFVNASPIGDLTIFFLALDAHVVLSNATDNAAVRVVALRKFFKGYKQLDKDPLEYIDHIWFQLHDEKTRFNFEKVSKRTHLDIASVNSACAIKMNDDEVISAAISAGGVGPVPMYLSKASELLAGKKMSEEVVEQLIEIAQTEISPISDVRGSETYKRMLLGQLIKAHFIQLFPELVLI